MQFNKIKQLNNFGYTHRAQTNQNTFCVLYIYVF